ncbi:hypothetical protein ACFYWX_09305 [Streptomyces sp. NPDC002888]|uniref:hypothetical protein n=1 Tax=Streptomyces sp. NPDC002888 TaxID=3364668 RepID=UPI00367A51A8
MSVRALVVKSAGAVAALAAAAGLLGAAAPPASAAPVRPAEMKFYDDYWTEAECRQVGEWGKANGRWTIYVCQFSGWDYDLYYDS